MGLGGNILKGLGEAALSFIPGVGPILSGLSKVAKAVGGSAGEKIAAGISTVNEGLNEAQKQPLSPAQEVELEKAQMETEVELAEIGFKREKLVFDDQAGGREVIKTALLSDDPVVRQARPKMMILIGKSCIYFVFYAPLSVIAAGHAGFSEAIMANYMSALIWIGGFLFGTFTTSFTGYTVARSADKKAAAGEVPGKLLSMAAGLGRRIS